MGYALCIISAVALLWCIGCAASLPRGTGTWDVTAFLLYKFVRIDILLAQIDLCVKLCPPRVMKMCVFICVMHVQAAAIVMALQPLPSIME